jgi:hypothetical protein
VSRNNRWCAPVRLPAAGAPRQPVVSPTGPRQATRLARASSARDADRSSRSGAGRRACRSACGKVKCVAAMRLLGGAATASSRARPRRVAAQDDDDDGTHSRLEANHTWAGVASAAAACCRSSRRENRAETMMDLRNVVACRSIRRFASSRPTSAERCRRAAIRDHLACLYSYLLSAGLAFVLMLIPRRRRRTLLYNCERAYIQLWIASQPAGRLSVLSESLAPALTIRRCQTIKQEAHCCRQAPGAGRLTRAHTHNGAGLISGARQ